MAARDAMTWQRFNPAPVLRGHWKGLTNSSGVTSVPDWFGRLGLLVPSVALTVLAYVLHWSLHSSTPVLAGGVLLVGATLSAFSQLSTFRLRLTERAEETWLDTDRDALDESAAHLLTATLVAVLDVAVIIVGQNIGQSAAASTAGNTDRLVGIPAALAIGLSTYLGLLFFITIPRLYYAYVSINKVSAEMSGFHRSRRR